MIMMSVWHWLGAVRRWSPFKYTWKFFCAISFFGYGCVVSKKGKAWTKTRTQSSHLEVSPSSSSGSDSLDLGCVSGLTSFTTQGSEVRLPTYYTSHWHRILISQKKRRLLSFGISLSPLHLISVSFTLRRVPFHFPDNKHKLEHKTVY